MNDIIPLGIAVVICMIIGALLFLGSQVGVRATRQQAIAAGVAQWTVNPTNGETKFEWRK
ncbi:MAG: hypothetical protein ACRDEA_12825 [Microcystaceae cyanobacterium]